MSIYPPGWFRPLLLCRVFYVWWSSVILQSLFVFCSVSDPPRSTQSYGFMFVLI